VRYGLLNERLAREEVVTMSAANGTAVKLAQGLVALGTVLVAVGIAWATLSAKADATALEAKRIEAQVIGIQGKQHACELDLREVRTQTAAEIKSIGQRLDGLERGMAELLKRSRRER
jgi:hypothetical protein